MACKNKVEGACKIYPSYEECPVDCPNRAVEDDEIMSDSKIREVFEKEPMFRQWLQFVKYVSGYYVPTEDSKYKTYVAAKLNDSLDGFKQGYKARVKMGEGK